MEKVKRTENPNPNYNPPIGKTEKAPLWVDYDEIVERNLNEPSSDETKELISSCSLDVLRGEFTIHKKQDKWKHDFLQEKIDDNERHIIQLICELSEIRDKLTVTLIASVAALFFALVSIGLHIIFS